MLRWLVLGVGLLGAGLILYNTVSVQRQLAATVGPSRWGTAVILSRAFLVLPFLILAATGGRWPGIALLTAGLALGALLMLGTDLGHRLWIQRILRARQQARRPLT